MAEQLLPGHLQARQELARLQASNPAEFARRYGNMSVDAIVAADRSLGTMMSRDPGARTQLADLAALNRNAGGLPMGEMVSADLAYGAGNTPKYSTMELERIARERQATLAGGGGIQALAAQDYQDQLDHAAGISKWWDENPTGKLPATKLDKIADFGFKLLGAAALATVAVAAIAGAGASAMGAASTAGNTAAASAGAGGAATAGATTAAVNTAVTTGVGTVTAAGGAGAATAATSVGAMQVVTITGTKLATTALPALAQAAIATGAVAATAAVAAGGEGVAVAESALPGVEVPALNHAPVVTPAELAAGAGAGAGVGGIIDKIGNVAGVVGNLLGGEDGKGGLGTALSGPALAAALAGLTSEKMPENAQLNGSIDKLTSSADKQMAEWNEWMFPKLKDALADNKTATDAFVGQANANAGQMEGMGASARGLGDLYAQRNRDVYIPLADKIIADANKFNKEGFAEQQSGLAVGDLASAYAAQRVQQAQTRAQYGVDPSSGRSMAIDAAGGINMAASSAAAATRARMAAEELWGKKQVDALGTSTALNANANTINSSYNTAGGLYSGATGLRQQGVKATSDYFTNAGDLAKTSTNTYNSANNALSSAGQLGLGKSKIEGDRYIAEQQGRGQVIGAAVQGINQNGGVGKTITDTIGAVGSTWNALKGLWE